VPWCRFFIPKIASPHVKPEDADLNDHIMYAKCVKGHVLRSANDWILCENLPSADAKCWQEGGDTVFSLLARKRSEEREANLSSNNGKQQETPRTVPTKSSKP
jgi:hypothetical protein